MSGRQADEALDRLARTVYECGSTDEETQALATVRDELWRLRRLEDGLREKRRALQDITLATELGEAVAIAARALLADQPDGGETE